MIRRKDEELADPKTPAGRHVGNQLLRSGTSPGANYEEARGSESNADFVHKMSVVLKELKESRYWLKVILSAPLVKAERLGTLLDECEQLIAIIGKSLSTARQPKPR